MSREAFKINQACKNGIRLVNLKQNARRFRRWKYWDTIYQKNLFSKKISKEIY